MNKKMICIVCPMGCHMSVDIENDFSVEGNQCKRGQEYAKKELTFPVRTLTSTVKISGGLFNRLPVRTNGEIPKSQIMDCMKEINKISIKSPVKEGDILVNNILNSGIDLVASRDM